MHVSRQFPLKLQHFRNDLYCRNSTHSVQSLEFPLHLFTTLGRIGSDLSVESSTRSALLESLTMTESSSRRPRGGKALRFTPLPLLLILLGGTLLLLLLLSGDPLCWWWMMLCYCGDSTLLFSATSIERRQPRPIDADDDDERNGQRVRFWFLLLNTRTMTTTAQVSFTERNERWAVGHYQLMSGCRYRLSPHFILSSSPRHHHYQLGRI